MQFVLDNSVVMRWLFADGSQADLAYADYVLDMLTSPNAQPTAPAIWPLEVANVIARGEAKGLLVEKRSIEFLRLLDELDVTVDSESIEHALKSTLQLARRFSLSAYDSAYLELALRIGAPIATLDSAMRDAATKSGVGVL